MHTLIHHHVDTQIFRLQVNKKHSPLYLVELARLAEDIPVEGGDLHLNSLHVGLCARDILQYLGQRDLHHLLGVEHPQL